MLPRKIKKIFKPDSVFAEKTKDAYLSLFDAKFGNLAASQLPLANSFAWKKIFKIGAVALATIIILLTAGSVYADKANVSAESSFYPLKRLGESVELAVVPASDQPTLEAEFAVQREEEIGQLNGSKGSSSLVQSLKNDLKTAMKASLQGAVAAHLGGDKLARFCNVFSRAVAKGSALSVASSQPSLVATGTIAHFETSCLSLAGFSATATATPDSSTTAGLEGNVSSTISSAHAISAAGSIKSNISSPAKVSITVPVSIQIGTSSVTVTSSSASVGVAASIPVPSSSTSLPALPTIPSTVSGDATATSTVNVSVPAVPPVSHPINAAPIL